VLYLIAFAALKLLPYIMLIVAAPVVLFRSLVLFPSAIRTSGSRAAFARYGLSVVLSVPLLVFESGNLTGFSWERFRYVSDEELFDAAIRANYQPQYRNLEELRTDYPGFTPEVRYWNAWNLEWKNSLFDKLLGFTRYQVRLPQSTAILDTAGKVVSIQGCDTDPCPPVVFPVHPEFGVIGTVQIAPSYDPVTDFEARWSSGAAEVLQAGNCFSAHKEGIDKDTLTISQDGAYPLTLRNQLGFFRIGVQLHPEMPGAPYGTGGYRQQRITKAEFLKWKSCSQEARDEWPDLDAQSGTWPGSDR
jgi:hypothetical protein